jgi:antitoxin MazE
MPKTATLTIQQWGNSLAVRIPAAGPRKLTLAEKLAKFDPATHGSEAMVTGRIGTEVF